MNQEIPIGLYRHYTGKLYVVFGCVYHTESKEQLVLYGKHEPEWVRPVSSFLGAAAKQNGQLVPRFQFIGGGQEKTPVYYSKEAAS